MTANKRRCWDFPLGLLGHTKKEKRNAANAALTHIMKDDQQMLEEAYHDIPEEALTCHDIQKIEDEWITKQKNAAEVDEIHRLTRPHNRKVPHEI